MPTFLAQRLEAKGGDIVEIPRDSPLPERGDTLESCAQPYALNPTMGKVVGQHNGAQFFTVGQRKGLGVGGKELPLFVLGTDVAQNIVYVGQGHDHPYLNREVVALNTSEVHWVNPYRTLSVGDVLPVKARLRYRQPLQDAVLYCKSEGFYLRFSTPQRGVTPGQFAAWYDGQELLGSAPVSF